jgi:hypothetical protein
METNVDSAAEYPEDLARVVYAADDDRANKSITVREASEQYRSWRLAHYKTRIMWR